MSNKPDEFNNFMYELLKKYELNISTEVEWYGKTIIKLIGRPSTTLTLEFNRLTVNYDKINKIIKIFMEEET